MRGASVAETTAVREAGFATAIRELRGAQKSAKGVSLYTRFVNRPAARIVAAAAYRIGMTPNQVTLLGAALSYAAFAAVALAHPSWKLAALAYLALWFGYVCDSADGQLARLLNGGSPAGEWLDHVLDAGKITGAHAAVLISFYRFCDLPNAGWLLLPLGFQLAAVLSFTGGLLADKLKPRTAPPAVPVRPSTLRAVALLPVDYGVFCAVFLLLGSGTVFRWTYAVLFCVQVLFLVALMTKWYRELLSLGPATAR